MARAKKNAVKLHEPNEATFDFNKYQFNINQKFKLTKKQINILKTCQKPDTRMVILDGPAGVSKTYVAMLIALEKLRDKKVDGITALRSSVISADSEIGFLAGTIDDKMKYFSNPFGQKLKELLKDSDVEIISKKLLDVLPVSFLRSYSFTDECLILSESQNVMNESLFLCASRAGEGCFVIMEGDSQHQNDLGKKSGFKRFCEAFDDEESRNNGIYYFKFGIEDIVRSEFVKYLITKRIKENI